METFKYKMMTDFIRYGIACGIPILLALLEFTICSKSTIPFLLVIYSLGLSALIINPTFGAIGFVLGLVLLLWVKISFFPLQHGNPFISLRGIRNILKTPKKGIYAGRIIPRDSTEVSLNKKLTPLSEIALSGGILITGSAGSGKALRFDTIIPTPLGNIPLGKISVGDKVYAENGEVSYVTDKYYPMPEKFYKLTFNDGTVIHSADCHLWKLEGDTIMDTVSLYHTFKNKVQLRIKCYSNACDDGIHVGNAHLMGRLGHGDPLGWNSDSREEWIKGYLQQDYQSLYNKIDVTVKEKDSKKLQMIRQLFRMNGYSCSGIKDENHSFVVYSLDKDLPFEIINIEEVDGNPNEYICLEVDHPSHMFLCTESLIPTHNTTTLLSLIAQGVKEKKPVVFVDYKGDLKILDQINSICEKNNIPCYEFSHRGCNFSYDPFINLNETGKVEALMNTRKWDMTGADSHYRSSTQLLIQNVIRSFEKYRKEHSQGKNYLVELKEFLPHYKYDNNEKDGYHTLEKMIDIILSSAASEMFSQDNPFFTFQKEEPFVVCFSFVSANKSLANSLSSFIFQDILDRGTLKKYIPGALLIIDELGTLESSTLIKDISEKGRSGGIQAIFSLQDINQLSMTSGEFFVKAILGTINSFIIHAGATTFTAEMLSKVQNVSTIEDDIMLTRKPYKKQAPTAVLITKYPMLKKKGSQEVYLINPYIPNDIKGLVRNSDDISTGLRRLEDDVSQEDNIVVTNNTEETYTTNDVHFDPTDFL